MAALEQQKVYIYWDLRVLFCTQAGVPQTVLLIPIEYSQLNLVHMCLLGTSPMNPHISIYGVVLDVHRLTLKEHKNGVHFGVGHLICNNSDGVGLKRGYRINSLAENWSFRPFEV